MGKVGGGGGVGVQGLFPGRGAILALGLARGASVQM